VILFLVSLGVLFAASLVAVGITRAQAFRWHTDEMPALPAGLALSTLILLALSATLERARASARLNRSIAMERALWASLFLAACFLLSQSANWVHMARGYRVSHPTLYPFTFHVLTGLHALHVAGGMLPLGWVMRRAGRQEYSSSRFEGLTLCAWYWHFLGVVWLVLLAALYWMS